MEISNEGSQRSQAEEEEFDFGKFAEAITAITILFQRRTPIVPPRKFKMGGIVTNSVKPHKGEFVINRKKW